LIPSQKQSGIKGKLLSAVYSAGHGACVPSFSPVLQGSNTPSGINNNSISDSLTRHPLSLEELGIIALEFIATGTLDLVAIQTKVVDGVAKFLGPVSRKGVVLHVQRVCNDRAKAACSYVT
jgi:hypothetical protein